MSHSTLRALITDDEPDARNIIKNALVEHFPDMMIVGEASGVEAAARLIPDLNPDLLFLDVELGDGNGFDLLDRLQNLSCKVIFTTAHNDYAIKAFRYNAIDYLLKPIDTDEFVQAVNKCREHVSREVLQRQHAQLIQTTKHNAFDKITLRTQKGHVFTQTHDITRIETFGNYSFVYLKAGERLLVSRNLKEFEEMLPVPDFFRIHQSHIVNTSFVGKVIKQESGDQAIMADGSTLPISRRRKEEFINIVLKRNT